MEDYCLFKTIPGLGQRYSHVAMKTFSPEESDQVFDPVFFNDLRCCFHSQRILNCNDLKNLSSLKHSTSPGPGVLL